MNACASEGRGQKFVCWVWSQWTSYPLPGLWQQAKVMLLVQMPMRRVKSTSHPWLSSTCWTLSHSFWLVRQAETQVILQGHFTQKMLCLQEMSIHQVQYMVRGFQWFWNRCFSFQALFGAICKKPGLEFVCWSSPSRCGCNVLMSPFPFLEMKETPYTMVSLGSLAQRQLMLARVQEIGKQWLGCSIARKRPGTSWNNSRGEHNAKNWNDRWC